ncbi:MAG TPA: lactonase family protein [Acidobacteriaceae bacterium]|nr:lactonase family protein [Acidobacteriaceae bacterium]
MANHENSLLQAARSNVSMNRRSLLKAGTATVAAGMMPGLGWSAAMNGPRRILVGSGGPQDGILSFGWDAKTGVLTPEGIAADVSHSTWLGLSPDKKYLYVACELEKFEGKPTGAVASFALSGGPGKLTKISQVASLGRGTCHLAIDRTGKVVICANYSGGSAASFLVSDGRLEVAAWDEQYHGGGHEHLGPNKNRQESAHAHFITFSPDNRFVYVNDLGQDRIHIYKLDAATAKLTPAGEWKSDAGAGPRTLHFAIGGAMTGKVAYCMNELACTVDVLEQNAADGSLKTVQQVELLPPNPPAGVVNSACDAVLTKDGRFAYFANRGDDFLMGFHIDGKGRLKALEGLPRTETGGKVPRNFTLDPTERWMLVANQVSSNLTVFARDAKTGRLAEQGKNYEAATPMCIVFV